MGLNQVFRFKVRPETRVEGRGGLWPKGNKKNTRKKKKTTRRGCSDWAEWIAQFGLSLYYQSALRQAQIDFNSGFIGLGHQSGGLALNSNRRSCTHCSASSSLLSSGWPWHLWRDYDTLRQLIANE
ncbi:hypothetical protein RchiOBHm_Chr7g0184501 [Rosa chinensis]|uniref:Uncharacterized protein n=1 Tax=Rosa chinensis TaxID=74649 RepID=A0A2P6P3H4_ROSCH|nr:uncharacterized protein LOC112180730 [Rosa chinensis]PRQ16462.1 hypothetical protein RchiOBHm_Chr7g0184501 [Rosa chinensis]